MPSQFFGLNTAYTGLLASNAAMNTTANNIANVQTEGFSRQQVKQQAANALRVFQKYGCAGAGVETLAIERVRDEFYDGKYWDNRANVGEYSMKQYYVKQIETYYMDDGTSGFKSIFDKLTITGLQELMKDPSNGSAKSQFVGYAAALAEYFNGLSGNMQSIQKDINAELKLKVDEINSIAGEIATINKQINTIELSSGSANELRDRRALLLDQLAEIVDVKVQEFDVVDTNNPDRKTGATRCIVKIAGGQLLVDDSDFKGLECVARREYEKVNQSDIDGLYDVYWVNGSKFNLYNAAMGGDLAGLVALRDGNNGEFFNGTVKDVYNDGTADYVKVSVSSEYLFDLNKSNLSDQGGIINLGNQEFYYTSWTYEKTVDASGNASYAYIFKMADNELNPIGVTNDRINKEAAIGPSIAYQGVPYYMRQMNEWVRNYATAFNDVMTSGYNSYNEYGAMMFTGKHATDTEQYKFTNRYDVDGNVTVGLEDDSYYWLTAQNFDIVAAMELDPSLMANRYDITDGVEQNDLLKDIRTLSTDKNVLAYRGASASEFLQCMLSDVALNAASANTFERNFTNISDVINTQRMSISGVDEDEEALNLIKYQNGYNLASKMIQTLTEIYDRLILETGV